MAGASSESTSPVAIKPSAETVSKCHGYLAVDCRHFDANRVASIWMPSWELRDTIGGEGEVDRTEGFDPGSITYGIAANAETSAPGNVCRVGPLGGVQTAIAGLQDLSVGLVQSHHPIF